MPTTLAFGLALAPFLALGGQLFRMTRGPR
jgi:hypothetical protein